jgi:dipeptidyl aminopeptidase/acylaminoacyl peptidase
MLLVVVAILIGFIDSMNYARKEIHMKTSHTSQAVASGLWPEIMGFKSVSSRHSLDATIRRVLRLAVAVGVMALAAVAWAGLPPPQLLSARNPALTPPAGGNGDSPDAVVSPDGRFVAFSSTACDLVPGGDRQFFLNVYLRDRASNTTVRVSSNLAGTAGGDTSSFVDQVSTNGQFVLFESGANNLAAADTNWTRDIFVCNVPAGTNILLSVATNGGSADGSSYDAVMTPDGRYVAFVSLASNLVSGITISGTPNVFVRDLVAGTTTLVSVGSTGINGFMATPQITPDGRYVAFFSTATGLAVQASTNGDVYVRDCVAGTTTWASTAAAATVQAAFGAAAPAPVVSYRPRLSDDGRYVAFMSGATTVSSSAAILVYDQSAGTTTLVTTNALASLTPGTSYPPAYGVAENRFGPEMSTNGQFIAYASREPAGTGTNSSIHVWDSASGADWAVSTNASGVPPNTISYTPAISGDGEFVAFLSNATNLVANPVSPGFHLYLCNLQSGGLQLVDVDTNGAGSTDLGCTFPSVSSDGRVVVFTSPDGSLVNSDWNNALDVFARDTVAGTNKLISQRDPTLVPAAANGIARMSSYPISGDGRWLVFETTASDLLPDVTNGCSEIFLRDLWSGQTTLVSAAADGTPAVGGVSWNAVMSANGRYVVFASTATNLTTAPTGTNFNIYRKDLQTGVVSLVSVSRDGTNVATADCSAPIVSADGRYVAFQSTALNLAFGTISNPYGNTFWRDMNSNTNIVLNSGNSGSYLIPSMSADGRYVAYQSQSGNLLTIRETQLGYNIYTNYSAPIGTISPDGSRVLYVQSSTYSPYQIQVCADQIATGKNIMSFNYNTSNNPLSFNDAIAIIRSGQWSSDDRYVAFIANPTRTNANAVYLYDLTTSNFTLVSYSAIKPGVANATSDLPTISNDGRYVAYRSYATDIVAADTNPAPKIYLFDRVTGQNAILSPAQNAAVPFPWVYGPVISGGGENVAFLSAGSDLVANDLNRFPDAFSVRVRYRVQMTPVTAPGGTTTLAWQTAPSRTYGVQFKNNLTDPLWQDLGAGISFLGNEGMATVPADQTTRFFRVQENQ